MKNYHKLFDCKIGFFIIMITINVLSRYKKEDGYERDSNIVALRVLAMAFIVISYYSVHGSIKSMDLEFGFNIQQALINY